MMQDDAAIDHEHEDPDRARRLIAALLQQVGRQSFCAGCQAPIRWVRHLNGKPVPYNEDGENHFITCPKADQFRRRKNGDANENR